MAKLSEIHRLIGNYLKLHGDKDVISIAACCGGCKNEYTLHLHDVHVGTAGTNPFTGEDCLPIPKQQEAVRNGIL